MRKMSEFVSKRAGLFTACAVLAVGASSKAVQAADWQGLVGAESPDRGSEALAFLPNEFWIHAGDSIHWTFPTHERHTLTFLKPGQTRPAGFGPVFGVIVGCPGATADGSSFDGTTCVTSDVLMLPEDSFPGTVTPTYSVSFPTPGNFKFVCLIHADMTGQVHVMPASVTLPYDQTHYDQQAQFNQNLLLADASRLQSRNSPLSQGGQSNQVAVGIGEIVTTTGSGSQTASLMRFVQGMIIIRVGDTVEWTSLDPSINHTVTFGVEPTDPRPASSTVTISADGARQATISSPTDSVNSGFLTPTPQDRSGLAQAAPNVTRFRVTFTAPGTYNYICAVHDQLNMNGTVMVH